MVGRESTYLIPLNVSRCDPPHRYPAILALLGTLLSSQVALGTGLWKTPDAYSCDDLVPITVFVLSF